MSDSEIERLRVLADAFSFEATCYKMEPSGFYRESTEKALDRLLVAVRELKDKYAGTRYV